MIRFTVFGIPQQQGSKRAVRGSKFSRLIDMNAKLSPWRQDVSLMAMKAMEGRQRIARPCGVSLEVVFVFLPPKKFKGIWKTTTPDQSKLVRAIEDSMSGIVYDDDSQVCLYKNIRKLYGSPARAEIEVCQL